MRVELDWISIVQGQRALLRDAKGIVAFELSRPNLTRGQITRLANQIDLGAIALNTIISGLCRHVIDEAFFYAASSLRQSWAELAHLVECRRCEVTSQHQGFSHRH